MFKETLDKLSISSREAVVDGNSNSFDKFKEYLHVERQIDVILEDIVLRSIKSNQPRLILISGNVGDGKSHLLARLFKKFPEEMAQISVRNDATESNSVAKSWVDELDEFLCSFQDGNVASYKNPIVKIVAINLGVLSRFLNDTDNYVRLQEFVNKKGILDNLAYENFYHEDSFFQFINLADFKLFSLSEQNADSQLLKALIEKITLQSSANPFHTSMAEYYLDHPYKADCIMRFNFLQLEKKQFQEGLVNLVIYAIVKFKLIISIRDLLDFINDLIVPYSYQKLSGSEIKKLKDYTIYHFQVNNSIYNKLFDSEGRSSLLSAFKKIDPLKLRSEHLDGYIFRLSSSENPLELFSEKSIDFSAHFGQSAAFENKKELIKTFVRTLYLNNISEFNEDLIDFHSYCKFLFAYHVGKNDQLKPLYRDVLKAIQSWNGYAKDSEINIPVGKHQLAYNITQQVKINANIRYLENKSIDKLDEFESSLPIDIRVADGMHSFKLDFNLYQLIRKVINGYCPNRLDREDHIDFQKFVEMVTVIASNEKKELIFEEISGGLRQRFILSYDESFGYNFNALKK